MKKSSPSEHSSKERNNWHHIIPQSLDGSDIPENKYRWNKKKHQAYHQLFRNHPPSIVIKIIEEWTNNKGELDHRKMSAKDLKAWKKIFGDWRPSEAIQFIREKFLPVEEKFLRGELRRKRCPKI